MRQLLLFPDPRPLPERLGRQFFLSAPEKPGVYLMRDAADTVLYVGKARNLRKRLGSYRVANPDRMPRRHLRMLRSVVRIELRECADESAALAHEAELLRSLRPRFNRAGTWQGTRRHLVWRIQGTELSLTVAENAGEGWNALGPWGAGARWLKSAMSRLLWLALNPDADASGLPAGWFGRGPAEHTIDCRSRAEAMKELLGGLAAEGGEDFIGWLCANCLGQRDLFTLEAARNDIELVTGFLCPELELEWMRDVS